MKIRFYNELDPGGSSDYAGDNNRGFLFGDGFFTTGLIKSGQICHHQLHWRRLAESAERLCFEKQNIADVKLGVQGAIQSIESAAFRLTFYRRQVKRGYSIADDSYAEAILQVFGAPNVPGQPAHLKFARTPISLNRSLAGLKHLNRLDNVLAASEVTEPDQEVIMCFDDRVFCGSRSNLFIYRGDSWLTPSVELAGIAGITRQRLLSWMAENAIKHQIVDISKTMLKEAKAAFVCNSLMGIWPVARIEDKVLDTHLVNQLKSDFQLIP